MSCNGTPSGTPTSEYLAGFRKKVALCIGLFLITLLVVIWAITQGSYALTSSQVIRVLLGMSEDATGVVIWNIRMPRIAAALVVGWALSLSGLGIQSLLKNPLGSPSTLGISQGAAFGAALAIVIFGGQALSVTAFAFVGLIAPHTARRIVGADHGLLIPVSATIGALLLLSADTVGRVLVGSGALPVGVITSFMGAPMFLYLLVREYR